MERTLSEIEALLWSGELKKTAIMIHGLFSRSKSPVKVLESLYKISKELISKRHIKTAVNLLGSLKTYSLAYGEIVMLTDVKNLLSYCYRLKKQLPEAVQECKDSISICKTRPELVLRLPVLHLNLSAIYREDLKNFVQAKQHAELAYRISQQLIVENPNNKSVNRHLAVSILALGQIEECLLNKEAAVTWYSQGLELENISSEISNQFRSRLYGVSFKKASTPHRRSIGSRHNFLFENHNKRYYSQIYPMNLNDSANTSLTTSSHFSGLTHNKY